MPVVGESPVRGSAESAALESFAPVSERSRTRANRESVEYLQTSGHQYEYVTVS